MNKKIVIFALIIVLLTINVIGVVYNAFNVFGENS